MTRVIDFTEKKAGPFFGSRHSTVLSGRQSSCPSTGSAAIQSRSERGKICRSDKSCHRSHLEAKNSFTVSGRYSAFNGFSSTVAFKSVCFFSPFVYHLIDGFTYAYFAICFLSITTHEAATELLYKGKGFDNTRTI